MGTVRVVQEFEFDANEADSLASSLALSRLFTRVELYASAAGAVCDALYSDAVGVMTKPVE